MDGGWLAGLLNGWWLKLGLGALRSILSKVVFPARASENEFKILPELAEEQRKMLRMMLQIPRRAGTEESSAEDASDSEEGTVEAEEEEEEVEEGLLEDWIAWVQRTTRIAEAELKKAHVTDWVSEQRKRYWDFAGRIARSSDER